MRFVVAISLVLCAPSFAQELDVNCADSVTDKLPVVVTPAGDLTVACQSGQPAASSPMGHALTARLRSTTRWLGIALAIAMLAGAGGFLLLHDYQKVRVLRTLEQWVTAEPSLGAANTPDGR